MCSRHRPHLPLVETPKTEYITEMISAKPCTAPKNSTVDALALRRDGGRWLKDRRERAGLSQRQLAELIDVEYYTFVSQLETGRGRIPPEKYGLWASAVGMLPRDFVLSILPFYEPLTYKILFEDSPLTCSEEQ